MKQYFWDRLIQFKNNKSYFKVMFLIIPQLGFQKACWNQQVEIKNFLANMSWKTQSSHFGNKDCISGKHILWHCTSSLLCWWHATNLDTRLAHVARLFKAPTFAV